MTGAAEKLRAVALATLMVTSLFAVVPGVAAAAGNTSGNTGDTAGNGGGTDLDGPGPAGMYGSGTDGDPYIITTVDQLQAMEQDLDAYYALGNDIDASETAGWNDGKGFEPVGNNSNVFIGEFDGRGYTISNLTIDRPTENDVGLFGLKRGSAAAIGAANDVENVTLTNVSVVGNERVGALIGRSGAAYHQHVHVQGTVTGNESVGGIVGGSGQSSIRNVSANVTVSGTKYIGGIVGFGDVFRILDSSVTGSVDGETAVGGAVGYLGDSETTENVSSTATVDGSSEVGGLVGLQEGLIRHSSASGTVSGETNVGGLVGDARGDIVDSRVNGTVTGDTSVGGLVGQVTDETTQYADLDIRPDALLSNVSASGTVTGNDAVGGLVGELSGKETSGSGEWEHGRIDNASSTGAVVGNTNTGGLVGAMRESASGAPRIQDSWANGTLTTPLYNREFVGKNGGLVGYVDAGTVERVWANTSIDAEEAVGGLVGRSEGTIRNASSTGDVDGVAEIGGLVGNNTGTVADSTASVSVLGRSETGGLVGGNYGTVTRSSSTGPVLGGQQFVGGLVGANVGTTTDSWATGLVDDSFARNDIGGIIGVSFQATEDTLYWDRNATNRSVGVGRKGSGGPMENVTGLTTAEMTGPAAASNMSRLDFTSTWATTNRYPQLAFEPAFDVTITGTNEPVTAGENLTVNAEVTNTGDVADQQAIWLTAGGQERGQTTAVLEPGQSTTVTLNWSTDAGDAGDGAVTVSSPDATATETVTVDEPTVGTGPAGMVGSGTDGDPYVITNATQLQAMEQDLDAYYALGNDIDASETAGWNEGRGFDPVGRDSDIFAGGLDGRGHTIAGLTIDRPTESNVGLFGYVTGGSSQVRYIDNVTLTNVSVVGNESVGGFAGEAFGNYYNIHVQGTVTGNESVGGIFGLNPLTTASNVSADVTVSGTNNVGGIVGASYTFLTDSSVNGSVDGETNVGGAVGFHSASDELDNVTATTTVSGETNVGGLVGLQGGEVRNSSASGTVSGETNVGGLAGDAKRNIIDSWADGTVTGDTRVGGLVGQVTDEPVIQPYRENEVNGFVLLSNVSAAGNVTGNDAVGGLVGELTGGETSGSGEWVHGRIDNASSTGAVVGNTNTGGLVGAMGASASGAPRIQDSWANGNITTTTKVTAETEYVGGFVGYLQAGTIENIWANATIDASNQAGGLVGRSDGTIREASSTGDVKGIYQVGGLVGNNTGTVVDSTASATVTGFGSLGGLAGRNFGTVTRSSSTGPVFDGRQFTGGLVGANLGTTTDSWATGLVDDTNDIADIGGVIGISFEATEDTLYWDRNATTRPVGVGDKREGGPLENVTGLTTAEMTGAAAASNMSRLDFASTWATTNRYPQLAFEPAFDVTITGTNEPVTAGENLTVNAEVTNTGDVADRQAVWLTAGGQERGQTTAVLEPGQSRTVALNWSTDTGDVGDSEVTVLSPDDSATRTVTVEPLTVDADASAVAVTSPHVADDSDAATVTATVVDTRGQPMTGLSAENVTVSAGGDAAVATEVTETSAGVYEVTVTDGTAESVAISVAVDGVTLTDQPTVEFVAPAAAVFDVAITETNAPVTAGETLTVTATVTNTGDAAGTQTVTVSDTGFSDTTQDAVDVTLEPGESNSSVTLSWTTADGDAGSGLVTVASDTASATQSVTVEATEPPTDPEPTVDADASTVTATTPHVANGSDPATVTATVVDTNGDPVAGLTPADFGVVVNGSAVTTGISETETGVYELNVTDDTAETVSSTVTADGVALTDEPTIEFVTARAGAFFDVNVTETNTPVRAGNDVAVSVNVTNVGDAAGTQTVTATARYQQDAGTVTLDPGASTTVELGWQASVFDQGENIVVVESANASDSRTVTIGEPLVDPSDSTIDVTSPHVANGSDPATVTVTLVNDSGQRVTGLTASEITVSTDATVASDIVETSPGIYEFTLTSETAGAEIFDVVVDGVVLFDTPFIRFSEPGTPYFDVEIAATNSPVPVAENLTVSANVTNEGDTAGTATILFGVSEGLADQRDPIAPTFRTATVSLGPGESNSSVEFAWRPETDAGGYYRVVLEADTQLEPGTELGVENQRDEQTVWVDIPAEEPTGTLATMAGTGTADDPYVVTTVDELQAMAQDTHAHYVLGNDIDAAETADWNDGRGFDPVGTATDQESLFRGTDAFTGSFDGRNHTITNLTVDRPEEDYVGLFGAAQYARVENVALVGGNVTGGLGVGGLVGVQTGGAVSETAVVVPVTGTDIVGGVVGGNSGTVARSYATGNVTARSGIAGGLVGVTTEQLPESFPPISVTVTQSYATGTVTADTASPLVGVPESALAETYATGSVDGGDRAREPTATVIAVYWDSLTTGQRTVSYGEGLETPQLTGRAAATSLDGFDFATTWIGTESYPRLAWSLGAVSVAPADATVEAGNSTQTTVTASFVDGTTETATTTADYRSSDTSVATVNADGTITAVGAGTATITVALGGETATTRVTVPDGVAPTADAGGDRTATPRSPVSLDASGSGDNAGIDSYEWAFGDGTTATGETVTHRYDASGTYTVSLTVTDTSGNDATASLRVEVRDGSDDSGGSDESDDSSNSDDSDDSDETDDSSNSDDSDDSDETDDSSNSDDSDDSDETDDSEDSDETVVTVDPLDDSESGWTVAVSNARADTPVTVALSDESEGAAAVTVLQLNVSRDGDFELDVTASDRDESITVGGGSQPIETLRVNHSIVDSDIQNVTFTFRVDGADVDPSTVALYRQSGENWTQLPTRSVDQTNGSYYFQATSPGLSEFAIASGAETQPTATETPVVTDTPTEAAPTQTATEPTPTTTTGGSGPGMGILAALLALVLAIGVRYRRQS